MRRDSLMRQLEKGVPTQPSIDDLRREFRDHGLEGWLMRWVVRVLFTGADVRIASRYNAQIYSPTGTWDVAGVLELVHGFVVEKGIDGGVIEAALQRARTAGGAAQYLETALRNYTISSRQRDTGSNIFHRLVQVLDGHPQLRALRGIGRRAAFGLDEWEVDPPSLVNDAELRDAVRWMPNDVHWFQYESDNRHSPGIVSGDLARIAFALVSNSGRLWTASQVKKAIDLRFEITEGDAGSVGLPDEEFLNVAAGGPSVLDRVLATELAERALACLTDRQREILAFMIAEPGAGVREIAAHIGFGKSTVANERELIHEAFAQLGLGSPEERMQVVEAVGELLAGAAAEGAGAVNGRVSPC